MKHILRISAIFIITSTLLIISGAHSVSAATPYDTYNYSYTGDCLLSPDAYIPADRFAEFGEAGALNQPGDIVTDSTGRIFIADTGNDRIVVLNKDLSYITSLDSFTNEKGGEDSLKSPGGIFVTADNSLYVADTENGRIVLFDAKLNFAGIFGELDPEILPENFTYKPKAVAANKNGRLYIISKNTNMGVIAISKKGKFEGFIGAQRVSVNAIELFWRMFMSQEQLERSTEFVPVEYSNLTIDSDGFIFVTSSSINRYDLYSSLRSTSSSYAPIKKINPSGTDLLRRNGFFAPVGDVNFDMYTGKDAVSPSSIEDVVLLENEMYMLVDKEYSKLFVYDSTGNLLYAFGGTGESVGLYTQLIAAAAHEDRLYTLDQAAGTVTVLEKTAYAKQLDAVITLQENGNYEEAIKGWGKLLKYNNNLDMAYFGIGKGELEDEEYAAAMASFKLIENKTYYSKAFQYERQNWLSNNGIWLVLGILAALVVLAKLTARAKKLNNDRQLSPASGKLSEELLFGWFVIFHPLRGFYAIKHEKRGSVKSASIFLGAALAAFLANRLMSAYLVSSSPQPSPLSVILNLLLPVILWCGANWCVTSLSDGKGKLRDIYIALCYSLIPVTIILILATIISHGLVNDELAILSLFTSLGYFWMIVLVFLSSLTIHDFSLQKNMIVSILSIVVIGLILFLCITFFSLLSQIGTMVVNLIKELSFR